jgi:hypothetical protein
MDVAKIPLTQVSKYFINKSECERVKAKKYDPD